MTDDTVTNIAVSHDVRRRLNRLKRVKADGKLETHLELLDHAISIVEEQRGINARPATS